MGPLLLDLFRHQAWADAAHWRAIQAHGPAAEDRGIRERLHHIHMVQRGFLAAWRGGAFVPSRVEDFASAAALKEWGREYHAEAAGFLARVTPERLAEPLRMPWAPREGALPTVLETMHHLVMHSQYHRGQNATRLRELGGAPPFTDVIAWIWQGRPDPAW